MTATLKRLLIAVALIQTGACTMTPLDLVAPAGLMLIRSAGSDGPISVESLLKQARGDTDAPAEPASPISVEAMLANARGAEPTDASTPQQTASVEAISIDDLRAQVLAQDSAAPDIKACK